MVRHRSVYHCVGPHPTTLLGAFLTARAPGAAFLLALMAGFTAVTLATPASTQGSRTFKARLSVVPIDVAMQSTIAGVGAVSAALAGTKLTVNGTFEGLRSSATIAQLHRAPRGIRGPLLQSSGGGSAAAADLQVTHGTSGTISGSIDLTSSQVTDLEQGRLYLQLHSEKAPDGNLWGWLLPQEGRR
jgi:hypothetical protein